MEHIKNFLDKNVLPTNLEDLKGEIRSLLEKSKNGTTEAVATATAKVTRFVRTVTEKLKASNLKKFFVTGKNLWVEDSDFQEFLKEITDDNAEAPATEVTYHWHATTETAYDDVIWPSVGEQIIDMSTKEGMAEARNRLNYLKTEIEKQPKGADGTLLNNGYANVIGQFKLKSGRVLTVNARWSSVASQWFCLGWFPLEWYDGNQFLSRNGETQ